MEESKKLLKVDAQSSQIEGSNQQLESEVEYLEGVQRAIDQFRSSLSGLILNDLGVDFEKANELIKRLIDLPNEFLNDIQNCSEDNDLLRFVLSKIDDEKFISDFEYRKEYTLYYYKERYPYLKCYIEGFKVYGVGILDFEGYILPDLPSSIELLAIRVSAITNLEEVHRYENLKGLQLYKCHDLRTLDGIEVCSNLEDLEIIRCESLTSLEVLEGCTNLQSLELSNCDALTSLKGVEKLENLLSLNIKNLSCLQDFNSITGCESLARLTIDSCSNLKNLSGIKECKNLKKLRIQRCDSLTSLKGIEECESLQKIKIDEFSQSNLDPESKEILKRLEENPDVKVVYI